MPALDLGVIDRDLDALGVAAERLDEVRSRARRLAADTGGLEGLLELVGAPAERATPKVRPQAVHVATLPGSAALDAASDPDAPWPVAAGAVDTIVPDGAAARETTFEAEVGTSTQRIPGALDDLSDNLSDELFASAEIPAVLSVVPGSLDANTFRAEEAPVQAALAEVEPLELESEPGFDVAGAAPLDSLFQSVAMLEPVSQPLAKPPSVRPPADLEAELAALFADESEPPPPPPEPEAPEAPIVFDADAMMGVEHTDGEGEVEAERTMLVRSADVMMPGAPAEPAAQGDFELDFDDDILEIDEADFEESPSSEVEAPVTASLKSRPPEPPKSRPPEAPKSRPPEAPGKGFLDRLLNRKG